MAGSSASQAVAEASTSAVEDDPPLDMSLAADEFEKFYRQHPRVAPDLFYILEVYKNCDRIELHTARPAFEEAYTHVFGSSTQPACERCNPAFYREKRILGAPFPR